MRLPVRGCGAVLRFVIEVVPANRALDLGGEARHPAAIRRVVPAISRCFGPVLRRPAVLLQQQASRVGDVGQNDLDVGIHPSATLAGRDALRREFTLGLKARFAVQKILEDAPDNGGFLGDWNQHVALPAVPIDAEVPIGDALLHALPGAPLDVFGQGAYFLLGEGCQKRKHQLTVVAQ